MITHASTRPKGLKRGVSTKKYHEAMGWGHERGLAEVVCQLDLTAERLADAGLLKYLFDVLVDGGTVTIADPKGKTVCTYTNEGIGTDTSRATEKIGGEALATPALSPPEAPLIRCKHCGLVESGHFKGVWCNAKYQSQDRFEPK